MTVEEQLQALREAEQHVTPPRRLESRLLRAFDDERAVDPDAAVAPARLLWRRRWLAPAAAAASLTLAAGVVYVNRWSVVPAPIAAPAVPGTESVVLTVEPPGVEETVRLVRMRVAPAALRGLGIESDRIPPGAALVDVDVLVGEDGVARGVRLGL